MSVRTALILALCSIFGAHGLVYLLVGVLPDAAAVSLGLESARPELMAAFHSAHAMRPYHIVLADLAGLDLGRSLDGVSVRGELAGSILASLPRLLAGFGLIVLVCVATALFARGSGGKLERVASLIAFLPPYLMPFLGLLLLLSLRPVLGVELSEASALIVAVLAIAATPAALIAAQTSNITRRNLGSDFARTLAAAGAGPLRVRLWLLHNIVAELAPSLEKMFTWMVATLLFAEPILGLGGFGTMAVRAVRRSDADLLLESRWPSPRQSPCCACLPCGYADDTDCSCSGGTHDHERGRCRLAARAIGGSRAVTALCRSCPAPCLLVGAGAQWALPTLAHPLGTDEFGRDLLATLLAAVGLSLLKGLAITGAALVVSIAAAELVTLRGRSGLAAAARVAANVVESVPVVLWIFIVVIAVPGPRFLVVALAFCLVVLPIATQLLSGEFFRLPRTPYVEAAYHLGAGEIRVLTRYILPNAAAVIVPFGVQILGAAIAVDGAIGVIGLGSRSDLDLGIFLLRGKENFFLHPQVLIAAVIAYGLVYAYLMWIGAAFSRIAGRAAADSPEGPPLATGQL